MNLLKEIEVEGYPEDNTPMINIFDDGTSYLLIDEWPMKDDDRFTENEVNNFEQILSDLLEVKVEQEDRDLFLIQTNDMVIIERVKNYMENK